MFLPLPLADILLAIMKDWTCPWLCCLHILIVVLVLVLSGASVVGHMTCTSFQLCYSPASHTLVEVLTSNSLSATGDHLWYLDHFQKSHWNSILCICQYQGSDFWLHTCKTGHWLLSHPKWNLHAANLCTPKNHLIKILWFHIESSFE